MARKREGTRVLNREEWMSHIENFYRSGLRPGEYYKQHGLTECQFYGWRKRYLALHPESADKSGEIETGKKFHPVTIEKTSSTLLSGVEIHYPHGVNLVIGSDWAMEIGKIKELIKLRV